MCYQHRWDYHRKDNCGYLLNGTVGHILGWLKLWYLDIIAISLIMVQSITLPIQFLAMPTPKPLFTSRHLPTQKLTIETLKQCVKCSKLTIKTPERWQKPQTHSNNSSATALNIFHTFFNFEHISHLVLVWTCNCRLGY